MQKCGSRKLTIWSMADSWPLTLLQPLALLKPKAQVFAMRLHQQSFVATVSFNYPKTEAALNHSIERVMVSRGRKRKKKVFHFSRGQGDWYVELPSLAFLLSFRPFSCTKSKFKKRREKKTTGKSTGLYRCVKECDAVVVMEVWRKPCCVCEYIKKNALKLTFALSDF